MLRASAEIRKDLLLLERLGLAASKTFMLSKFLQQYEGFSKVSSARYRNLQA